MEVAAKHRYVPNAYLKADKETDLDIYIRLPQGMEISREKKAQLGASTNSDVVLKLKKALYGLKQAGSS